MRTLRLELETLQGELKDARKGSTRIISALRGHRGLNSIVTYIIELHLPTLALERTDTISPFLKVSVGSQDRTQGEGKHVNRSGFGLPRCISERSH